MLNYIVVINDEPFPLTRSKVPPPLQVGLKITVEMDGVVPACCMWSRCRRSITLLRNERE